MALPQDMQQVASESFMDTVHETYERYGSLFSCPIYFALEIVRRKWAVEMIYKLHQSGGPVRFNQIERLLAPITQKELTKRLRELEQAGVVERVIYAEVPPRVEYTLTERGHNLIPSLDSLTEWGREQFRDQV